MFFISLKIHLLITHSYSPPHSLLSLASLSLSTSPGALSSKPLAPRPQSGSNPSGILIASSDASPAQVSVASSSPIFETTVSTTLHGDPENSGVDKTTTEGSTPIPISANGKQKKRGVDYKCESCAKVCFSFLFQIKLQYEILL